MQLAEFDFQLPGVLLLAFQRLEELARLVLRGHGAERAKHRSQQQEHIQAAEREIWSIVELPDAQRAEYLILRGKIAARREQYENAALYFHQAQELPLGRMLERELYEGLEVCCRELGDYQQAYLYASKQLAMQKETGKETRT